MNQTLNIQFKRLHPNAVIPTYAHPADAGLDLTATTRTDDNNGNIIYGTGLAIEIPPGYVGLIFPRSSIRNSSLIQANSVSVIDSGYRGEITVTMRKYFKPTASLPHMAYHTKAAEYQPGERIAQLIVMPYPKCHFIEAEQLSDSERGTKGYGSTGK